MESVQQKKEEEVRAHFQEAAASYKRLLSGNIMCSANGAAVKRSKTEAEPAAPVAVAAVPTPVCTQPSEVPVTIETPAPTPVAASESMPSCRTYFEANALLRRKGVVQASTLGRNAMPAQRAIRDYNLVLTEEQKGYHGLQVCLHNFTHVCTYSHLVSSALESAAIQRATKRVWIHGWQRAQCNAPDSVHVTEPIYLVELGIKLKSCVILVSIMSVESFFCAADITRVASISTSDCSCFISSIN